MRARASGRPLETVSNGFDFAAVIAATHCQRLLARLRAHMVDDLVLEHARETGAHARGGGKALACLKWAHERFLNRV
jgi:hypothetical protein